MTPRDEPGPNRDATLVRIVAAAVAIVAAVLIARIGYDKYSELHAERYAVTREDDGRAITRIVSAAFGRASALKVGTLTGIVQGTATDSRLGGLLTSDQVTKSPFSVDYFVDVSRLRRGDLDWDAKARVLTVDAPDVTVAAPNIDAARTTLVSTRGVFVTRGAAEALAHRIAVGARRKAAEEAGKPDRVNAARDNARAALGRLMAVPLAAAGFDDVRVRVRFPADPRPSTERWDVSRSVSDVLANAR